MDGDLRAGERGGQRDLVLWVLVGMRSDPLRMGGWTTPPFTTRLLRELTAPTTRTVIARRSRSDPERDVFGKGRDHAEAAVGMILPLSVGPWIASASPRNDGEADGKEGAR
ncbi:hypothetical protein JCM2811A_02870 [Methylorubrum rhodinum]